MGQSRPNPSSVAPRKSDGRKRQNAPPQPVALPPTAE